MPRGNPQPWFRPSRNTWYVTVEGVQHNLHTPDKSEAIDRWHRLMGQSNDALQSEHADVAALLAAFADWSERHTSESTYDWYCRYLKSFLDHAPSGLTADRLKPFHVTKWLDAHPSWGDSSRRGAIAALKRAFQWCVDEGFLDRSPVRSIKKPAIPCRQTTLTRDQRQLILQEASDDAFRDLLIAAEETGVRPQELCKVEARHVDLENGLWVFAASEHKTGAITGKPRIIFLTENALNLTRRLVDECPNGPLFRNSRGQPWTSNAIRCRFRRMRKRLSEHLPQDLCAYLYRHTYATDALENGVDPITVAELMGHRDATMVSRVYQHVGAKREHMLAAAERATSQSASQ
ncbi:MAG: site-specific integrase [Planctomycetota bacterium]|nr:MAG: site-specific integrase [Planctomycetota bacterium]